MYNTIDSGFKIHILAKSASIVILHLYFFSDLNNSTVPMTDDNGNYVSVIGKYNNYSFAICCHDQSSELLLFIF